MLQPYKILLLSVCALILLGSSYSLVTAQETVGFQSPIPVTTPAAFLINIIRYILSFVALLALLALIIGGARMMLSLGDEQRLKNAKQIMFWAVMGLIVIILSFVIIQLVARFLGVGVAVPTRP